MASKQTIAGALAFLHELFPTRDITDATGHAYQIALAEFSDDELRHCVELVAKEPGRKFFPTPGDIAAHRQPPPAIDCEALLGRISKLGCHDPRSGWIYPTSERIRESLGDAVADAYVNAGSTQCFAPADSSGATVSRDIARRRFADAIHAAHQAIPGGLQLPARTPEPLQLPAPELQREPASVPSEIPAGPLAPEIAAMTGLPVAQPAPVDESKVPDRPTITSFCDGCRKLKKVSRYSRPGGGIWWLCAETCAPKPHEIIRTIVAHSPPPPDAVPNPAVDQWIEPVPPPDLDADVPAELLDLEIDQQLARADAEREGVSP